MKIRFVIFIYFTIIKMGTQAQEVSDTIATQYIEEVVVKAESPQIKSENGVMVVDLPNIVKDKPVTNILESLVYLPGVTSQGGAISLVGANSTTIITGVPLKIGNAHGIY